MAKDRFSLHSLQPSSCSKPAPFEKLSSLVGVKAQKNAWQLKNSGGSKFVQPLYDFKESQRLQLGTQSLKADIRQLCSFIIILS